MSHEKTQDPQDLIYPTPADRAYELQGRWTHRPLGSQPMEPLSREDAERMAQKIWFECTKTAFPCRNPIVIIADALMAIAQPQQPTDTERLKHAIEKVWSAWPDIRQLIEGWAVTTPKDEWSTWDEETRQKTIRLSFLLEQTIAAMKEGA